MSSKIMGSNTKLKGFLDKYYSEKNYINIKKDTNPLQNAIDIVNENNRHLTTNVFKSKYIRFI